MVDQKAKKSWYKRWWAIILYIIIILAIIGSLSGKDNTPNSDKSQVTNQINDYTCPELSTMKLLVLNAYTQLWDAQITPYKSGNAEVVYISHYGMAIQDNQYVTVDAISCDVGSQEGQNANWIYCGDFLRPIVVRYTDDKGTIIKKRSVEVTFDKNTKQYLSTKCDTYDVI